MGKTIAEQAGNVIDADRAPAPWLPGRGQLLASVRARLAGNKSVVLIGPSGIGKTAVLEAVAAAAEARGERVLRVAGAETERWLCYAGFADLLDQVPSQILGGLRDAERAAVERVLARGEPAGARGHARIACRLAWQTILLECARAGPVLLVVDDAQWLDTGTVEVITQAARRTVGADVRAVVAGRWPDASGAGGSTVSTWLTIPGAEATPVPPLTAADLAELLDQYGLPARVVTKLHADSGGNPYLALALGGAFADGVPKAGRPMPLPRCLHVLISERIGALPEPARETLLVAALADRPTINLLVRAGRVDAAREVRLAAAAGLLATDGDGIRFTPPSVRTVLAESYPAGHLAAVHHTLSTVVTDPAGRARHRALASADPNAEMARSLVTAAESARRRGAHRLAAELYLLAADRTPTDAEADRLEWLVAAAEVGAIAISPEIVHHTVDSVLAADSTPAQRIRVRMALIDLSGQALAEMDETFAAALVDAEQAPEFAAELRLRSAWAALIEGQPARAERAAGVAAALAGGQGDPVIEGMALAAEAMARRVLGREDYRGVLDRALALPQVPAEGLLHLSPRFVAARFAVFDDRLTEAREELLTMLAMVERGAAEEIVWVLRCLSEVSVRLGRCRDALDYADRAFRISEEAGLSPGPGWYGGAVAELAGGSVGRAESYARRGIRASEQERDSIYLGRNLHVLGQVRLRTGDARGGVAHLRRVQALERDQAVSAPLVIRWHGDLASGLATLGEWDESDYLIRTARKMVEAEGGGPGVTARLDRAEAILCAARGDVDSTVALLDRATRSFGELGESLERGHCLLVRAKAERRRRHYGAGRAAVAEAMEIFTRCEAKPWIEQAGRALSWFDRTADAGHGTEPSAPNAFATLTSAEERIARMVGEGASNQEVAEGMYLSVKTIEASLTRIYRKLGVRSRTQLSSRIRDARSVPWQIEPR